MMPAMGILPLFFAHAASAAPPTSAQNDTIQRLRLVLGKHNDTRSNDPCKTNFYLALADREFTMIESIMGISVVVLVIILLIGVFTGHKGATAVCRILLRIAP